MKGKFKKWWSTIQQNEQLPRTSNHLSQKRQQNMLVEIQVLVHNWLIRSPLIIRSQQQYIYKQTIKTCTVSLPLKKTHILSQKLTRR
jgi:hypothetical protein